MSYKPDWLVAVMSGMCQEHGSKDCGCKPCEVCDLVGGHFSRCPELQKQTVKPLVKGPTLEPKEDEQVIVEMVVDGCRVVVPITPEYAKELPFALQEGVLNSGSWRDGLPYLHRFYHETGGISSFVDVRKISFFALGIRPKDDPEVMRLQMKGLQLHVQSLEQELRDKKRGNDWRGEEEAG